MSDLERLTDALRVVAGPDAVTKAWERGYATGRKRAWLEMWAICVALYFGVALVGRWFGGTA